MWCQDNNLFNVIKTKEMTVDYRKRKAEHAPILIDWALVEQGRELQVTWCPHHQQTIMVQTHQDSHEKFYICTIKNMVASQFVMPTAWHQTARCYRG